MEIGKRIRSYREKQGLTQGDLATRAHISRISLGNYERGERVPPVDIFLRIAQALHVSTDELLGYDPEQDELTRCLNVCKEAGLFTDPWQFRGNTIVSVYQNKEEAEQDKFSVDVPVLGKDEFIAAVIAGTNNPNYQAAKKDLLKMYVYASILQKYAKSAGNINVDIESLKAGALPSKAKNAIQKSQQEIVDALQESAMADALQENPDK